MRSGTVSWQAGPRFEVVPPRSVSFTFPWELHGGTGEPLPGIELIFLLLNTVPTASPRSRAVDFAPGLGLDPRETRRVVRILKRADRHHAAATDQTGGGQLNEVSIKAELAEAYLNMGDKEEALRILEEILGVAGPEERQRIAELIRRANS